MLKIIKKFLSYSFHTPLLFSGHDRNYSFALFGMYADTIVMIFHNA